MPDHPREVTNNRIIGSGPLLFCGVVLTIFLSAPAEAGIFDFFATPKVEPIYAENLLKDGRAYLEYKEEAFEVESLDDKVMAVGYPNETPLENGENLVEVRGYFDANVKSKVGFDDKAGFSYQEGDSLAMRVYCAGLFVVSAENEILRHLYKTMALRNMSNPKNKEEEFTLVTELPDQKVFEAEERLGLMFPDSEKEEGKDKE